MHIRSLLCVIGLLTLTSVVHAGGLKWEQLNQHEKQALHAYKHRWYQLAPNHQHQLRTWVRKQALEKKRLQQRQKRWQQLSLEKRKRLKHNLKRLQAMSRHKRANTRGWHQWMKHLPAHEQRYIKKNWRRMNNQQRHQHIQRLRQKYK